VERPFTLPRRRLCRRSSLHRLVARDDLADGEVEGVLVDLLAAQATNWLVRIEGTFIVPKCTTPVFVEL
jgi:hypothetical protein